MRLKVFNFSAVAGAVIAAVATLPSAQGAGLPVVDGAGNAAIQQGFQMQSEDIRQQTEAITNAIDYQTKALSKVIIEVHTNQVKTEQALETLENFSPDLSKSRAACTTAGAASIRGGGGSGGGSGSGASRVVSEAIAEVSHKENLRSSKLSPGEPRDDYFNTEAIRRLQDPDDTDVVTAFKPEPVEEGDYSKLLAAILFAMNPLPQPTPSKEELDEYENHGSPIEKGGYAKILVHNNRLQRMQQVVLEQKEKDVKQIDGKTLRFLIKDLPLSKEEKKMFEGKLSENQVDEFFATYRIRSEPWVKELHVQSPKGVANEMALMQAEQLRLLWAIERQLAQLVSVTAQAEANRLNQAGATEF